MDSHVTFFSILHLHCFSIMVPDHRPNTSWQVRDAQANTDNYCSHQRLASQGWFTSTACTISCTVRMVFVLMVMAKLTIRKWSLVTNCSSHAANLVKWAPVRHYFGFGVSFWVSLECQPANQDLTWTHLLNSFHYQWQCGQKCYVQMFKCDGGRVYWRQYRNISLSVGQQVFLWIIM